MFFCVIHVHKCMYTHMHKTYSTLSECVLMCACQVCVHMCMSYMYKMVSTLCSCVFMCVHVCSCVFMCVHVYVCVVVVSRKNARPFIHILTYIHTYMHTYRCTYTHTHKCTYIHTYSCTYSHTHRCTYIHACTHTNTFLTKLFISCTPAGTLCIYVSMF